MRRQAHRQGDRTTWLLAGSIVGWLCILSLLAHYHMSGQAAQYLQQAKMGLGPWSTASAPTDTLLQQHQYTLLETGSMAGAGAPHSSSGCGALPDLGFDYPQLRALKVQLQALLCHGYSQSQLMDSYISALARLGRGGGGAAQAAAAPEGGPLAQFLADALARVADGGQLMPCTGDASLLAAAGVGSTAFGGGNATAQEGGVAADSVLDGRRYLLAANLHNSGLTMPNFITQVLRLAVMLAPGSLGVSVYESGSNDRTREWAALLRMLLLPLRVPHNITTSGALKPTPGLGRIELLAALRNALVDPFFSSVGGTAALSSSSRALATARQHASASTSTSGGSSTSTLLPGWAPERLIVANDVFFCAEDALRLALHGAHIACGFDFYTAPWDAVQSLGGSRSRSSSSSSGVSPGGDEGDVQTFGRAQPGSGRRALLRQQGQRQRRRRLAGDGRAAAHSVPPPRPGLRFYDKWVARDIAGAKLSNTPPFVAHAPSQAALASGQPVAAYCCWNGLAVLDAAPFAAGLRFRSHQAGECAASECSLLCDDYHRLGFSHVVLDPGVRLGYDYQQAAELAGGQLAGGGGGSGGGDGGMEGGALREWLGPRLPWAQVADASAALRRAAAGASGGDDGSSGGIDYTHIECCDLQPGRNYVNFSTDCRCLDVRTPNHTAAALAARGAA